MVCACVLRSPSAAPSPRATSAILVGALLVAALVAACTPRGDVTAPVPTPPGPDSSLSHIPELPRVYLDPRMPVMTGRIITVGAP